MKAKVFPMDDDNKITQDAAGVWRLWLNGVMQPERYANQREALRAYNAARLAPDDSPTYYETDV